MRKRLDLEPRLAALSQADLAAQKNPRSWMPAHSAARAVLDPAHWSQRVRQANYWRMVEIWSRTRRLH
jgi:hypothetical protein